MIHLVLLNRQFGIGGAERQLIELLKHIDKQQFRITVVTFYDGGLLQSEIEAIEGICTICLHKGGRYDVIPFLWRLWRTVEPSKPDIVHGYLDMANVLALLVGRLSAARVVWGIRASDMDLRQYGWMFRLSLYLQDILGRFADLVIVNSYAGQKYCLSQGYRADKIAIIPNGIDTWRFHPNPFARQQVRTEWGVKGNEKLIGLVGRLDPAKDHPTFLRAARLLAQEVTHVWFACVGDGSMSYREELQTLAHKNGLTSRLIWAGRRLDMPDVYNALDIATSSSTSEGFPNVIGEAMACGVPCVVTDAGDSAMLVGDTGIVVPPRDPKALADGWKKTLEQPGLASSMGASARSRIITEFSVDKLAERTAEALAALVRN